MHTEHGFWVDFWLGFLEPAPWHEKVIGIACLLFVVAVWGSVAAALVSVLTSPFHLSFGQVLLVTGALALLFLLRQAAHFRARRQRHRELPRRHRQQAQAIDRETAVAMHAQEQIVAMGEHTADRLTAAAMGNLRRGGNPRVSDAARGALLNQTALDGTALDAIQRQHIASVQRVLVRQRRDARVRSRLRVASFLALIGGLLYWRFH